MDALTAEEHTAALVGELEHRNLEARALAPGRLWVYSELGRSGDTLVQRQGSGPGDDTAWFSYTERRNLGQVTDPAAVAATIAEILCPILHVRKDLAERKCQEATRDMVVVFAAVPEAVADARKVTTHTLDRWALPHLSETASLLVSELMTNAVKHAGGTLEVVGELCDDRPRVMLGLTVLDSLLIEVWDASSTLPARRAATDDQEDGRGLLLVEALSKEWGSKLLKTGGKITWLTLDLGDL